MEAAGGDASASRAFCEYIAAAAASEGALLRAPWLFSNFGTLRGTSPLDAEAVAAPNAERELTLRFQAGLGFSPTRFYQAGLLEDRARAECERRRAEEELRGLGASPGGLTRSALRAKIDVLEAALPNAEAMVRRSFEELEASRTTVREHHELELRVDELRQLIASASLELAGLPEPSGPVRPASDALARLRRWSDEEQAAASKLRRAGALSVTLRGGYDELLGVPQALPLFGSLSLELNPGWLWQRSHDERAERASAEAVDVGLAGRRESLAALGRRLEAQQIVLRRRLQEVRALLAAVAQRREALAAAGSAAAREYAEYIWFDELRLRADEAQLEAQVATIDGAVGGIEKR